MKKETNGEVALFEEKATNEIVKHEENLHPAVNSTGSMFSVVDLAGENLPDLSEAKEFPLDLMADYWTPTQMHETKRVYFDCIKSRLVVDQQTGEAIDLPCAYFYEPKGKDVKTISNGSKRLVGVFESGSIQKGTPVQITYLGKKKGSKFYYDDWSVKPLLLKS